MIDLTKYFDKIYVINLDKRSDRLSDFHEEIKNFDIYGVERFSAIDGVIHHNEDSKILTGEIGILMSHLEIIKNAHAEGLNNILILEDDVIFTDEINKLDEYMDEVPKNWDFIYFGGNHVYGEKPIKISDRILKLNGTVALQCVALNKSLFETLLILLPQMKKQVDAYYADLHDVYNAYGFFPNMAKQKAGYSDIQNGFVDYTNYFKD